MDSGLLTAPGLASLAGIRHGFETRHARLDQALPPTVLRLRQVHGAEVHYIGDDTDTRPFRRESVQERPPADAMVTALPRITLAVATADCVPLLVADPVRRGVLAAHAGWRGLALGVIPRALGVLAREVGSDPGECYAAIGPCVSRPNYRVGEEVRTAFRAAGIDQGVFSAPREQDHPDGPRTSWLCDLRAAAILQLRGCGLLAENIDVIDACTVAEPQRLHSWRRDGAAAGRMLAGIALQ